MSIFRYTLPRYASASLFSVAIDYAVFFVVVSLTDQVGWAIVCARIAAIIVNFFIVKTVVFHSRAHLLRTLPPYLLLVAFSGTITAALINLLVTHFAAPVMLAKVIAELSLFLFNYIVQEQFIFRDGAAHIQEPQ